MSHPPFYNSFDENFSDAKCIFCKNTADDRIMFGDKYTINGITFHNFCLVRYQRKHFVWIQFNMFFFLNKSNFYFFSCFLPVYNKRRMKMRKFLAISKHLHQCRN